jgi:hypothetical protein
LRISLEDEYPLDPDSWFSLRRDWDNPASPGSLHLHQVSSFVYYYIVYQHHLLLQDVEQGLQVKVLEKFGESTNLLLLCDCEFSLSTGCIIYLTYHVLSLPFFSDLVVMQVAILILFFLDAIREMQKYSSEEQHQQTVGWWVVNTWY